MTHKNNTYKVSCFILSLAAASHAHARYEAVYLWNAEYAGNGGAAVSSVDDSSALYFNPAGLAFAQKNDIALHISPLLTWVDGPAEGSDSYKKGKTLFSPIGGGTGLYHINDRLTLGYGMYAVGGLAALYKDVTLGEGATALTGNYQSEQP